MTTTKTTTTEARHRVRVYASEDGHTASCECKWRRTDDDAAAVRQAAAMHLRDPEATS